MPQLDQDPIDPEIAATLDAIDATLAGEPVDGRYAEIAEIALLLASDKPQIPPSFAHSLDQKVERRFAPLGLEKRRFRARTPRTHRNWSRIWQGAGAIAAGLAMIVVIVVVAGGGGHGLSSGVVLVARQRRPRQRAPRRQRRAVRGRRRPAIRRRRGLPSRRPRWFRPRTPRRSDPPAPHPAQRAPPPAPRRSSRPRPVARSSRARRSTWPPRPTGSRTSRRRSTTSSVRRTGSSRARPSRRVESAATPTSS